MAYTQPDVTKFKARYPEFVPVSDVLVGLVLAEAIEEVGDTWYERDRAKAQMLLTAHKLSIEGEPARTTTGKGVGASGPVKRRKVGDVETEFAGVGTSSNGSSFGGYGGSIYGQEFFRLLKLNFPSPMVV